MYLKSEKIYSKFFLLLRKNDLLTAAKHTDRLYRVPQKMYTSLNKKSLF